MPIEAGQIHRPPAGIASLQALGQATALDSLELAVVVPTFNERGNIAELVARLATALAGISYEVVIVDDDSPDGTAEAVRQIALHQPRVRMLRRIGRRGLASACLEGMMSTAAPYIAVMDGDLQHDESILPSMLREARQNQRDVVVASRNVAGASMGGFAERRVRLSNLGLKLSRLILHVELHDPMSGFFLVDRKFVEETIYRTSGIGFKILVDLLASTRRHVNLAEIPFTFRRRESGQSKLDAKVGLEYLYLVLDKLVGDFIPLRFVLYSMVGAAGVLLHLATLGLLYVTVHAPFATAQIVATVVAMTFNFLLNNLVTYRDAKLKGKRLAIGLVSFYLACSVGAVLNLAISGQLLRYGLPWLPAGFAGLAISSVWNYAVTNVTTWRRKRAACARPPLA